MGKTTIKFGIIGCGLMGREFALATARWPALINQEVVPEIIGICDVNENLFPWYNKNFPSIAQTTTSYQELLENEAIECIYCSVPHNLHKQFYIDIINAGKHLLGEKPFGIDLDANETILKTIENQPEVFVRCSSEFPYYPGAFAIHQFMQENPWGQIIEVNAGFLHSSDLNYNKPINWKRKIDLNGEYGCMGDLGMHILHLPLRNGFLPNQVYASLSNIVEERYDATGKKVRCETWDNATINTLVDHPDEGYQFPMTLKTYRIAPGEIDTWYIEVIGTKFSAKYSTKNPKLLQTMSYKNGGKQEWRNLDLGYSSAYKTITGGIFEFGFTDAILQMWAAFIQELTERPDAMPHGCITPKETHQHHQILTAALNSEKSGSVIPLQW